MFASCSIMLGIAGGCAGGAAGLLLPGPKEARKCAGGLPGGVVDSSVDTIYG